MHVYRRTLTSVLTVLAIVSAVAIVAAPGMVAAVSGSDWQAARILDDDVFFNRNTLNTGDIQNFLNAKVPSCDTNGTKPSGHAGYATRADWGRANGVPPPYTCLRDFGETIPTISADAYCGGINGGPKSAADIIFNIAQACGINPQVLLVLLQKEQSLVTDDWPWPIQYRSATGYGCPDTSACDSQYYGFFNQVYRAGRQFKRYVQQPGSFSYAIGRTSFISYQANAPSCGGTDIAPQSQATAALYNYTPYQPNAAALANLYGTGDSCSAYGNRNFWRMYNDWFGPTLRDGFTLAYDQSDNTQWVIYRNVRQYVPTAEIKHAWNLPDLAVAMPHDYLATIPQGPPLGRLFHLIGDPALYYADGGKKYYIPSQQMKDAWGLSGQPEAFVSSGLWNLTSNGGWLSYSIKKASDPALYMVDGLNSSNQVVLRQYTNPDVFHAWEGDNAGFVTVSDEAFAEMDNAVGTPLTGFTIKGSDPTQYQVISGQKLYLSGTMSGIFNQAYQSVSDATINRLVSSSPVTNFIRLPGNGVTIYMVDNGTKHAVSSIDVLKAWSPGGVPAVNILNQGFINLLSTSTAVSSYEADVNGQLYIMDGSKITVSASLDSAYRTGTIFNASAALLAAYPSASASGFLKGSGPAVYLIDQGRKLHIGSADFWRLWNGTRNEPLTTVSESVLSQFTDGGEVGNYFGVAGINYVIDNGVYHQVNAAVASDWGLANPVNIASATRDRFTAGSALSQKAQVGSSYYRIKYGRVSGTTNTALAALWGLTSSPLSVSDTLIHTVPSAGSLSLFAMSTNTSDNRIFLVDNGGATFYYISSIPQFQSYGYTSGDIVPVSPSDLGTPTPAQNIIKTTTANSERLMDGGQKHDFSDTTVKNRWVTGSNTLTISSGLWSYFTDGATINGNIKGTDPSVYTIDTGQKRWIQSGNSYQAYASQYGSFSTVSDQLLMVLPTGSTIP